MTTTTVNDIAKIVSQAATAGAITNSTSASSFKDANSVMSSETNTIDSSENLVALNNVLGRLGQIAAMTGNNA